MFARLARDDFRSAVDDGQAAQQVGSVAGQLEADHPAHADADQVYRAAAEPVEQRRAVLGEAGHAVAAARLAGAAVAAQVRDQQAVAAQQGRQLVFPVAGARTETVQQQDRRALGGTGVVVVDEGAVAVLEVRHLRSLAAGSGAAKGALSGTLANDLSISMRIWLAGPSGFSLLV